MVKMRPLAGLFALLLSLCLVHLCIGDPSREIVVVFKGDQTEVPYDNNNGTITMRKPRAFRVPAFVGGVIDDKEFLAVMCDARYLGFSDWSFIEAAVRTSYGDYRKWSNATIFAKNTRKSLNYSVMGDITAVMKGNKIFVLASSWDYAREMWIFHTTNTGWDPLMIVGTVVVTKGSKSGGASIKWETGKSLKSLLPAKVNRADGFQFIGGVGNGVVMKNGTIVFPIQISNANKEVAASIMYSSDDGVTWHIGGTTRGGQSEGSVVEWGKGKLILSTRYDYGYRFVYETDNMGKTWKPSLMFSGVWGNQPNRIDIGSQGTVITAPVDGKDVLLFSHPLNKKSRYSRDTLQLWMSDGQRIVCVGTISDEGKGESSGYSILATIGNNLYSTHEINPYGNSENYDAPLTEWDRVIALSPLPHFYKKIKNTVRAWRQLDAWFRPKGIPTDGIVGFLGNTNADDTVWADMYNCVNATVNGGKRVDGGFRFNGEMGSGAEWPVGNQRQNHFYIFTKMQFTLAATVTIHKVSGNEDVYVLGASRYAKGSYVLLGIGYTKEKKWFVLQSYNKKTVTEVSLVVDKEYHIAITAANGESFVYVDGFDITKRKLKFSGSLWISHFFLGGIGKLFPVNGSSCTVKNAMLFNRALSQAEITQLSELKKDKMLSIPKTTEKLTIEPENIESLSTIETKEASGDVQKNTLNKKANDKKVNNAMRELRDTALENFTEDDKSTAVSLSAAAGISLLCLFTALLEF